MVELTFRFLEKDEFNQRGAELFDLMYSNMSVIAPFKNEYNEEKDDWLHTYGGAFRGREERKIVLITTCEDEIKGFFGYCSSGEVFDMEEIQFSPEIQGKNGIFRRLYGFVIGKLSDGIKYVEACANRENKKSQAILERLGMKKIGADDEKGILFFRGDFTDLMKWYNK